MNSSKFLKGSPSVCHLLRTCRREYHAESGIYGYKPKPADLFDEGRTDQRTCLKLDKSHPRFRASGRPRPQGGPV